jgi:hypothetical protein
MATRMLRGDENVLAAGYMAALSIATLTTVYVAWALSAGDFAAVTTSVVVSTLVPLLFAWGIPDSLSFAWLQGKLSGPRVFASALALAWILASAGFLASLGAARIAGLGVGLALNTSLIGATGVVTTIVQGIELAQEKLHRIAAMVVLPNILLVIGLGALQLADEVNAHSVVAARAVSTLTALVLRLLLNRDVLGFRPSLTFAKRLLVDGTAIHSTALLSLGSLRLEQIFAVRYFDTLQLAAYGLVIPLVSGLRTFLYSAGTSQAISVAKNAEEGVQKSHDALRRVALRAVPVVAIGWVCIVLVNGLALDGKYALSPAVAAMFVISGAAGGLIDVAVRLFRAAGSILAGISARVAGLTATTVVGLWLFPQGLAAASVVGSVAALMAYLVLYTRIHRGRVGAR